MEHIDKDLSQKWSLIREQLITLYAFHKSSATNDFKTFLTEGLNNSLFLSQSSLYYICYFLLGVINREERDKLIKWPIVNIQGQAKFRKGVSLILKDLMATYPHFNLRVLHNSYLMDPNGNQKKILNFIIQLSNLALFLAIDDPSTLIASKRDDMSKAEFETATSLIEKAKIHEEKIIEANVFPVESFESIRNCMTKKCVSLKQDNANLDSHLTKVKKHLVEKGFVAVESDVTVDGFRKKREERFADLTRLLNEIREYDEAGKEMLAREKDAANPISLKAEDLRLTGRNDGSLENATAEAYYGWNSIFDDLRERELSTSRKEGLLEMSRKVKAALRNEQDTFLSFMAKYS